MVEMNQPFIVLWNSPPGITTKNKIELVVFLLKAS